jgi:regulator of replication initiation timing
LANKLINCTQCGKGLPEGKFYFSRNKKYAFRKKLPLCKDCVIENYISEYSSVGDRREAMIRTCATLDITFSDNIFEMAISSFVTRGATEESSFPALYISYLNSNPGRNVGDDFTDSEIFNKLFESGYGVSSNVQFKYDRAEEDIINLNSQLQDLEISNGSLLKENELLKSENTKLQTRLTSAETQLATLKISNEQEVARKEGLKIKLESEINKINSELSISKQNLANSDRQLKEKSDELLNLQKTIKSFDKQVLVLENDAEVATKNLEKYTAEKEKELLVLNSKYETETAELKAKISKLLIEIEDLKFIPKKEEDEVDDVPKEDIPKEYIFEWGEGFDLKDYQFMNEEATVWKEKHEIKNEAEELLLHEIIILKLQMRKKRANGDSDLKEDRRSLQDMIRNAQFIKRESINQPSSDDSRDLVGLWSKDIEDFSPAEWYDNHKKFRDIEGIDGYLKKHLTRPVKNFTTGSRDFDSGMDLLSGDDSFNE